MRRRLLFVDDEPAIRTTLAVILRKHGFDVTVAATVAEALQKITSETFEVLLSDLNIGNPGDGLTVVSAMRRTQPDAVTMILTGYPAFETALEAIRQQVDDYIVKPADVPSLVSAIEQRLAGPRPCQLSPPKRVAMLVQENLERVEELWLASVEKDPALSRLPMNREERLNTIRAVLEEVIRAAQSYSGDDPADRKRPPRRDWDGYTAKMALTEFCLLRRALSQVVQENLLSVNLSYLIPDLGRVNDSLDEQAQDALTEMGEGIGAGAR